MAANQQAWDDFGRFVGAINRAKSDVKEIFRNIGRIDEMKIEILDDQERSDELKKIIDQHPNHSITSLASDIVKLNSLRDWLETNTFL